MAIEASIHHLGQVHRPVTRVQALFHPALEPPQRAIEERAPGDPRSQGQAGELVAPASRLECEAPHPLQVRFAEEMEPEGPAPLDELPGMVRPPDPHEYPGNLGNDGGLADEGSDEPPPPPTRLRSHEPKRPVDPPQHLPDPQPHHLLLPYFRLPTSHFPLPTFPQPHHLL